MDIVKCLNNANKWEGNMRTQTNIRISGVEAKKTGQGNHGPWTIYELSFYGTENVYSYFCGKGHTTPAVNMLLSSVDYESETSECGKYTNLKIKKMVVDENAPQPTAPVTLPTGPPQAKSGLAKDDVIWAHGAVAVDLLRLSYDFNMGVAPIVDGFKRTLALMLDGKPAMEEGVIEDAPPGKAEYPPPDDIPTPDDSAIPF